MQWSPKKGQKSTKILFSKLLGRFLRRFFVGSMRKERLTVQKVVDEGQI